MGRFAVLSLVIALIAPAAWADGPVVCQAEKQCRGDAKTMCAPSNLRIRLQPEGAGRAWLWIDKQGPYAAEATRPETGQHWALTAFGGSHGLNIAPDGQFTFLGNRGKRFTGKCESEE